MQRLYLDKLYHSEPATGPDVRRPVREYSLLAAGFQESEVRFWPTTAGAHRQRLVVPVPNHDLQVRQ
jgi:hypothetical protein